MCCKSKIQKKMDQFRLRNDLPILASHFYLLRDERECACYMKEDKGEDSDSNRIGLQKIEIVKKDNNLTQFSKSKKKKR